MQEFKIHFEWRPVQVSKDGTNYSFPEKFTKYMRDEYVGPAVYRWRVFPARSGKKEEVYIGETERFAKRIQHVLNANHASRGVGQTNLRLKKYFDEQLRDNRFIALEWLDFPCFAINNIRFDARELHDPFMRKCVENLALSVAIDQSLEILNVHAEPLNKILKKQLGMDISGKHFREVLEFISAGKRPEGQKPQGLVEGATARHG